MVMDPNLSTYKAVGVAAAPRTAYVTFLAEDGDYWKGVVGLAKGLRRVHAAYQLVVAVLPDVPESHRRTLIEQGCAIREIQPLYPPDNQTTGHLALSCSYNERDHINCYAKLCWISQQFPEFERAVYVDAARVQVLENVDDLVELDRGFLYAWTMECFGDKAPWRDTPRYKIAYRDEESPDMVEWNAADAQLAELLRNAAVIVHEPGMPLPGKNRAAELGALFHYTTVSARATSMPCDETLLGKNHAGELTAPYSNAAVLAHQPGMAAGEALRAKPASTYAVQFPEFERMVYVDAARIQVLENVDDLVELDKGFLYAWTMDCFRDNAPWRDTPRYKIAYRDEESPDMVEWRPADAQLAELLRNAAVIVHEPGMPLPGKNRAACCK